MSEEGRFIGARQNRAPVIGRQVRNILYGAVSHFMDPDPSVVQADLARGRQALARRSRRARRRFLICLGIAAVGALGIALRGAPRWGRRSRPAAHYLG